MHGMTLAQVLVLFEGMADYLRLTNPWGSGESAGASPSDAGQSVVMRNHVGADAYGAGQIAATQNMAVRHRKLEELPAHVRSMLEGAR